MTFGDKTMYNITKGGVSMGENNKYIVKIAKNESEAQKIMNDMDSQGFNLFDISPMEGKWTWDILLTFVRA